MVSMLSDLIARKQLYGIVGGMGPGPTLKACTSFIQHTNGTTDQEYPPFVCFSLPEVIPDRSQMIEAYLEMAAIKGNEMGLASDAMSLEQMFPVDSTDAEFVSQFNLFIQEYQHKYEAKTQKKLIDIHGVILKMIDHMVELGVTMISFPCNTLHSDVFLRPIRQVLAQKHPSLVHINMIDETSLYLKSDLSNIMQTPLKRIGVLATQGTYQSRLFSRSLHQFRLDAVIPEQSIRDQVQDAIYNKSYGIKANPYQPTSTSKELLTQAIEHLLQKDVDAIILGSSEIPMAITEQKVTGPGLKVVPLVDPVDVCARKAVQSIYPKKLKSVAPF